MKKVTIGAIWVSLYWFLRLLNSFQFHLKMKIVVRGGRKLSGENVMEIIMLSFREVLK